MAKIMLGSLAGAISGALGNDVFSHNRHGAYVRRRVIPTKVTNAYTNNVRNILTICSRAWGTLDPEVQDAWNTYAAAHPITDRLGQKQVLFGAGAYTQLNSRLLLAGDSAITVPPTDPAPSPLLTLSIAATDAPACVLTFTATPLAAGCRVWSQVALLVNPGQNYYKNLLKTVDISAAAQATGLDIGTEIQDRFGALQADQRIILLASVFDGSTGLMSGPLIAEGTVTAA